MNQVLELVGGIVNNVKSITRLSGLSNQAYLVEGDKKVVCKIYKDLFPMFIDRSLENRIINQLANNKMYPKILAHNENYRVVEYIEGTMLQGQKIDQKILMECVKELANFASLTNIEIKRQRDFDGLIRQFKLIETDMQIKLSQKQRKLVNKMLDQQLLKKIKSVLPEQMILSHNDSNLTNFIRKPDESIILIDYQFSCLNYIGFDLGNLFNEIATEYSHIFQIHDQWQLPKQSQDILIQEYFKILQKNTSDPYRLVQVGRMMSHYFWFFIGVLSFKDQTCEIDLGYYLKRREQQFRKHLMLLLEI